MFGTRSFGLDKRSDDNRVAVIGLGRFGTSLACTLAAQGIDVLATDISPKRVEAVAEELSHVVVADSTDREAMEQVGIPEFSHVVVAIGTDIESSVLTTSLMDEFGIDDIWAKAITAQHARILRRVGAHHVVSPEAETGRRVAHLVTGYLVDFHPISEDVAIAELDTPQSLLTNTVADHQIAREFGVHLMAIRHPNGDLETPSNAVKLSASDRILVWGPPERLREMAAKARRAR